MLKSISIVFFSDGLSKVINFLAMFSIIKTLSVTEYSIFTITLTFILVGYQSACALIERLYISDYENYKNNANCYSASVVIFVGVVCFSLVLIQNSIEEAFLVVISYSLLSIFQIKRIAYQRDQDFRRFSILEFMRVVFYALVVFFLISVGYRTYDLYIMFLGLSAIISYLLVSDLKNRRLSHCGFCAVKTILYYFREKGRLIAYSFLTSAFPYLSVLSVAFIGTDNDLASYGVSIRFTAILGLAVYALNVVTLPLISSTSSNEAALMVSVFLKKTVMMIFGFLIVILIVGWVMEETLDSQYGDAILIFYILSICNLASFMSAPFANVLLRSRRYDVLLNGIFIGICVFLVSLIVLKSTAGIYVSAYAASICYSLLAVYLIYHGKKYNEDPNS